MHFGGARQVLRGSRVPSDVNIAWLRGFPMSCIENMTFIKGKGFCMLLNIPGEGANYLR